MQGHASVLGHNYQGDVNKEQLDMSVPDVLCDQLNETRDSVANAIYRVRGVADKFKGSEPPTNKPGEASGQIGLVTARTVESCQNEVSDSLIELHRQIDRLFVG